MPDIYDIEVARLTREPERIYGAWEFWSSPLFYNACREDRQRMSDTFGCLTQVKSGKRVAETPELTAKIRADERIPDDGYIINVEHLPVFAEYQRLINKELGLDVHSK